MGELTTSQWVFVVTDGLVLALSVFGNALVILSLMRFKELRSVTNIFVANLAMSDILLAGVAIPMKVHDISHTDNFHEGQFICKLVNFSPVLYITCSVYSMVSVSVERYRSVVKNKPMARRTCYITIVFIWINACIMSIPTIVEFSEHDVLDERNETFVSCGSGLVPPALSIFNGVLLILVSYLIPLFVIGYNYTRVAIFLSKVDRNTTVMTQQSIVSKRKMRIIKMMMIVGILFALCWLPYYVVLIISKITRENGSEDSAGPLALVMIVLSTFSAAYNIIVYAIYNESLRNAFKALICGDRIWCGRTSRVAPVDGTCSNPGVSGVQSMATVPKTENLQTTTHI